MRTLSPSILVIYPYASIDTNPTMTALLETLSERGIQVDVLLEQSDDFLPPESFGEMIHLYALPAIFFYPGYSESRSLARRLVRKLNLLRYVRPKQHVGDYTKINRFLFGLLEKKRYSAIVGVDPFGITFADRLNRRAKSTLVYISFELICDEEIVSPPEEALKAQERSACDRTSLVLIQDEEREEIFCHENSYPAEKVLTLPVAPPLLQTIPKTDFLRNTLGIAREKRIVLFCGNLQAWSSRDELEELVSYWPKSYCLVVHTRSKPDRRYEAFLRRLGESGQVYFSKHTVGRLDLPVLIASADFGLAPYKPTPDGWWTGRNIYHLGLSSGKVAFYAMCGLPILARSLPVFDREFAKYECGKVYRKLAETGELLETMRQDYTHYSDGARRFYRERLEPTRRLHQFCDALMHLSDNTFATQSK